MYSSSGICCYSCCCYCCVDIAATAAYIPTAGNLLPSFPVDFTSNNDE